MLVWQEGRSLAADRVKDKDRLPLTQILDIRSGRSTANLKRTGRDADNGRYMSFAAANNRTLDIELPTQEARDWLFAKFAELFAAYATAKLEGLDGVDVTMRVNDIMAGTTSAAVTSTRRAADPVPYSAAATSSTTRTRDGERSGAGANTQPQQRRGGGGLVF